MEALLVGFVLAIGIGLFATAVGLDRDRAFYPTVMIVIALLYILFTAIGGTASPLFLESLAATGFIVMAVIGFRSSLWIVAIALAAHGAFDLVHPHIITNPGVPGWWPDFCLGYDVAAGGYLAWLIRRRGSSVA